MAGPGGSLANRVSKDGRNGVKNPLTIHSGVSKDSSGSHRKRGWKTGNNAESESRNFEPRRPLRWPGKATDVVTVDVRGKPLKAIVLTDDMLFHWNKILSLSNKIADCSESEKRLERSMNYITDLYKEGPQNSPTGLVFRGHPAKELKKEFEAEKAQLQKIKQMWSDFTKSLDGASKELYETMSSILGESALLDLGEDTWYEKLNAVDPSRPKYEEEAFLKSSPPEDLIEARDVETEAFLTDFGEDVIEL